MGYVGIIIQGGNHEAMKVAIYTRVSKSDQDVTVQQKLCTEYCSRMGYQVYSIYTDEGVSGMKDSRPQFDQLLKDMRALKFECIVVSKLDRIGRSLQHILALFTEFTNRGCHFIAVTQSIDTSSAVGKFQLQMLGAMAEFERNLISERTREALKYAKNVGKRGPDKKQRKKRGVVRPPINLVEKR
jgi:DNA invertase Pin-like site-specific DNA recombinase